MPLYLFDTETTGLPEWRLPSDAPEQPHLVQIAGMLTDAAGNMIDEWSTLVQPGRGAVMHEKAFEAHGISLDRAMDEGVPLAEAWDRFSGMIDAADGVVGHNIPFDIRIMRIAGARANGTKWECVLPYRCTMKMAAPIVNLPPTGKMRAAGFFKPKPPSLTECMRHFFDEDHSEAHDALADVRASKRVYFAIKEGLAR